MLLQAKSSEQARLLELDGFSRTGERSVEVDSFEGARTIVNDDDYEVSKIVVCRRNSEQEATFIDEILKEGYSGTYKRYNAAARVRSRGRIKVKFNTIRSRFEVNEDKIVAKERLHRFLDGEIPEYPENEEIVESVESFSEDLDELVTEKRERIEEIESEIDTITTEWMEALDNFDQTNAVEEFQELTDEDWEL